MRDYTTYTDAPTLSARVARAIVRHPGKRSKEIAALVSIPLRRCTALITTLRSRGYVYAEVQPRTACGRSGLEYRWHPTDKLKAGYPAMPYLDTESVVLDAMGTRTLTHAEITAIVERPYNTVRHAIDRLLAAGMITVKGKTPSNARLFCVTNPDDALPDDDEDWTPAPYVNPIRARALGMGRAA